MFIINILQIKYVTQIILKQSLPIQFIVLIIKMSKQKLKLKVSQKNSANKYYPSTILQVQQYNSTSFDTTAHTTKSLDIFSNLTKRRKSYAFQLFKQFILFPSDTESDSFYHIEKEATKSKPRVDLNMAQNAFLNILSVINREKQKIIMSSFNKLKVNYIRKKVIYQNKAHVQQIINKIGNIIKYQHKQVLQHVFIQLIRNLNHQRARSVSQKQHPFDVDGQSRILRFETQQFFQKDSRIQIANDLGLKRQYMSNQITPIKKQNKVNCIQTVRTNKKKSLSQVKSKQIYVIMDKKRNNSSSKNTVKKSQYLKISIDTANVKIIQVDSLANNKNSRKYKIDQQTFRNIKIRQKDCYDCEFCKRARINNDLFKKLNISRFI